jgi:hypothetical protein
MKTKQQPTWQAAQASKKYLASLNLGQEQHRNVLGKALGWMLREAFIAGARWEKKHNTRS